MPEPPTHDYPHYQQLLTTGPICDLIEDLIYIRDRSGHTGPLRANAAQRQFELHRGRENIVLKARQMGMTTWIAARFFVRTILQPGTLTLLVAHNKEAAQSIFSMVRRMYSYLPEHWRKGPLKLSRANIGQLVFSEIDSEFRIASAGEDTAGRGLSVQNLHCSEVAHWPGNASVTLAGLRASLSPSGECVLESTPNGAYGAFYNEWQRCAPAEDASESTSMAAPIRHFFPWWLEEQYTGPDIAHDLMSAEELALVSAHGLTPAQIGYRRHLERSYGNLHAQEFAEDAETCFRATGSCCFDITTLEDRLHHCDDPHLRERNGALLIWWPPAPGRRYLLAVDTAGGSATGGFAAMQVVDVQTGSQCAELQQRLRPQEQARVAAELARRYNDATIVVERNNHGLAVISLLEHAERYPHLWRDHRNETGWLTTSVSKPDMIARLGTLLLEAPDRLRSRRLLAECRTFITGERGEMSAANGTHDDLVMSMALALAVRGTILLPSQPTN